MTQSFPPPQERELPMLAGIAGFIRWIEELVNLLSGPLLTIGLGIALVDLLSDGKLLTSLPVLLYVWAATQAVGVDAQLVATWDRARIAAREHRYWALIGLVLLGAVLAYVAWVAAQVFALQQSEGITTAQALQRLGMDAALWLIQRTALSVFLVCLAGWTRYHPPAKNVALDTEQERTELEAALELEPLRQQLRQQRVRGVRAAIAAARGRDEQPLPPVQYAPPGSPPLPPFDDNPDDEPTPPPPGGGRSPSHNLTDQPSAVNSRDFTDSSYDLTGSNNHRNGHRPAQNTRSIAAARTRLRVVGEALEDRKRRQRTEADAILKGEPTISYAELARRVGCGEKQAKQFKLSWQARQQQKQAAQ